MTHLLNIMGCSMLGLTTPTMALKFGHIMATVLTTWSKVSDMPSGDSFLLGGETTQIYHQSEKKVALFLF